MTVIFSFPQELHKGLCDLLTYPDPDAIEETYARATPLAARPSPPTFPPRTSGRVVRGLGMGTGTDV